MQPPAYNTPYAPQQSLPKPRRVNCFKPLVGCTLGPLLLVFSVVSCVVLCLAIVSARGPDAPLEDFEANRTAADRYEQQTLSQLQSAATNTDSMFSLQIDEHDFSSWLTLEYETLFERYDITQPDLWNYVNPVFQVSFQNEQVLFYAANDLPLIATGLLVTAEIYPPRTNLTTYLVDIDIVKLESGGFSLDDDSATLSANLAELITDQIVTYQQAANLTDITITAVSANDGILRIEGQVTP